MDKKQNPQPTNPIKKWRWILAAVLAVAVVAVLIWAFADHQDDGRQNLYQRETTAPTSSASEEDIPATSEVTAPSEVELPYSLENGKLALDSLFQYTGLNPDCNWEDGTDTGAVVLRNISEEYLESAQLTITLSDGTQLQFLICDIPAGKDVWAFESGNKAYDESAHVVDVQCEAVFLEDSGLTDDQISVSVEGVNITMTNTSGEDLTGLEIRCHSLFNETYFGGTSYAYPIETLANGESTMINAVDCFVGEAEVTIVSTAN